MIIKFEHKSAPLMSRGKFLVRVAFSFALVIGITLFSLALGTVGYWVFVPCEWIDALHNAAMILAGMGPVVEIRTTAGKLFSTFYALYSGIAYLTLMGIVMAPFYHRMLHHFHLDNTIEKTTKKAQK
jgi:hypothetical protein